MMNSARTLARLRLDERLSTLPPDEQLRPPPRGWVRAIRDALGMSGRQLAERMSVSPQTVDAIERSEAAGTVQLDTLRRAAEAMDCTLVYALTPRSSLDAMVAERARRIALRALERVDRTMAIEDQASGDADREARIADYIRDAIKERDLWDDP
jgi:predicted DNA-binding mobile mystery protein A